MRDRGQISNKSPLHIEAWHFAKDSCQILPLISIQGDEDYPSLLEQPYQLLACLPNWGILSTLYNSEHLVRGKKLLKLLCRCPLLCVLWHHLVKLPSLDELGHYVDSAHEFSPKENLRESGPLGIKLEPLPDSLVLQDVEMSEAVTFLREALNEATCKFALWLLW